jgi:GNAT superfamily N-acetyltransferase
MKIIKTNKTHKKAVVEILCGSFLNDPQINYIIGSKPGKQKRYKRLMNYSFEQAQANGYINITEDLQAAALWRKYDSKKMTFGLFVESILFFCYFGLDGMKRIIEMEKLVQKDYPKKGSFLYLWFIGTLPQMQGRGYGAALLNPTLSKCMKEQKAVYLETSTKVNENYYLNKGFSVYNRVSIGDLEKVDLWLMKKEALY